MSTSASVTTDLAPFRLDRICGVGPSELDFSGSVRPLLRRHAAADAELAVAAAPLLDSIFALVPGCRPADRRKLLDLKRRIHRSDPLDDSDGQFLISAGVADLEVKTWLESRHHRERVWEELTGAVAAATIRTAETLRRAVGTGALALSLPLIADTFVDRVAVQDMHPGDRAARTAMLYLVRATMKPSPLGHLTTVALHCRDRGSAEPQQPGQPTRYHGSSSHLTIPIGFVHRLFTELAATPALVGAFEYSPARYLGGADADHRLVVVNARSTAGFLWQDERIVDGREYAGEIRASRQLQRRGVLDSGNAGASAARVARWVRMGLVVPTVPWRPGSGEPLLDLAEVLRRSRLDKAVTIAAALESLHADLDRVARADAPTRRSLVPAVRAAADRLTVGCGAATWTDPLLFEDVATSDLAGPLPISVDSDLREVSDLLRPSFFRSHVYDLVLAAFRDRYGIGGRCADAADFFLRLQAEPGLPAGVRSARAKDIEFDVAGQERSWLPVGRTSAPPAAAVLYQLAASSPLAIERGEYLLVLNQLGSALGGLVTRFGRVLDQGRVARQLMPWLERLFPGCEVRCLTLSAQVNNLQHAGAGFLPELEWPTDRQPRNPGVLGLAQLSLVHDAATDTLEFCDRSSRPVAPVYTGIVPAGMCTGAPRLALAVMDPWVDGSATTRSNHPFLRAREALGVESRVTSAPRVSRDRVVLERARWLVPSGQFPIPRRDEGEAGYLVRVDSWRRDLSLPAEVFFIALGSDPMDADRRKPMWLDFASPHSIRTALPLIAGTGTLRMTEVLPARDEAWVGADRRTRSGPDQGLMCEHISFLAWDRTNGAAP